MRRSDFHYELPPQLIAERPAQQRSASRMLVLDRSSGALADRHFTDLPSYLRSGDLLVLNDTRVIPARLAAHKASGGQVEILLERIINAESGHLLCHVRANRAPRPGTSLLLPGGAEARVGGRQGRLFELHLSQPPAGSEAELLAYLERHGEVPLPPYIQRTADASDRERYQTVFASRPGAVAAPTAGLHFDAATLEQLAAQGVATTQVTLHVGAGTFTPVTSEELSAHQMHSERLEVSPAAVSAIAETRARGGRVVAVGTTVVRALESAAALQPSAGEASAGEAVAASSEAAASSSSSNGEASLSPSNGGAPSSPSTGEAALHPFTGETALFITPGYRFRVVDALLTNFHLPESTLLMLVSAFAGHAPVMAAYRHAVAQQYRFFSYGDAMLIIDT
ncbi:tRNA preQ1(34) S-adenosylmethionine ribosyltransferase-isomerase QueA [Halorhodospira abdelmalekii]|uniref:tRNA preQ1(34) S-adenosylmethionine ribosyltransferase-isomerase QueA n=1 Tax=Halorhodospira abdelmalekii TaxID=421629 RepID=UPI001902C224|nr:tRNA preQ1(34) S-adenosylmethionine ribosyltransferase-isomerase QueA [Halorhodospira abdelmalekii]